MATAIGTSWTTLATRNYTSSSYGPGTVTVYLQAYYSNVSGNSCMVHYRILLGTNNYRIQSSSVHSWRGIAGTSAVAQNQNGGSVQIEGVDTVVLPVNSNYEISGYVTGGTTVYVSGGYYDGVFGLGSKDGFSGLGTVPSFVVAPSGITVTVGAKTSTAVALGINVESYGRPDSTATGAYNEVALLGQNSYGSSYRYARGSFIVAASVDNDAPGDLNITSNTEYYYGGSAFNSILTTSVVSGQVWTLPETPVGSQFQKLSNTSASFNITETSVGTGRTVQLQYRYKISTDTEFGNWIDAGTPDNNQTETVTLTGLPNNKTFDVEVRSVAGTDISAVNTYQGAFNTNETSVSVVSKSYRYDAEATRTCELTINYLVSAVGSDEDTYDVDLTIYTNSGSPAENYNMTIRLSPASGQAVVHLNPGRSYAFIMKARKTGEVNYGRTTTWAEVMPTFVPNAPYISELAFSDDRDKFSCKITPATPGAGEIFDHINYWAEIYQNNSGSWSLLQSGSLYAEGTITVDKVVPPVGVSVAQNPKLRVRTVQLNTLGNISPESKVTFKNRPKIWGKVVKSDGTKLNIINVRVKDSSGTLSPGNQAQPFVIK